MGLFETLKRNSLKYEQASACFFIGEKAEKGGAFMKKDMRIDVMRGLACFMVLVIHVTSQYLVSPGKEVYRMVFAAYNTYAGTAVALFIFISAFSLTLGYGHRTIDYPYFLKRRLSKVALPFILWSLFYALAFNRGLLLSMKGWLGFSLGYSMYHLYYVVIILQLYALYPLLLWLHRKLPQGLPTLLLIIGGIWAQRQGLQLGSWAISDRFFLTYSGYFSLGIYAGLNKAAYFAFLEKHFSKLFPLWLGVGALASLEVFSQYSSLLPAQSYFMGHRYLVFAILTIFFVSAFASWLSGHRSSFGQSLKGLLETYSGLSMDVYFAHPFFLALLHRLWLHLPNIDAYLEYEVSLTLLFFLSLFFALLKHKGTALLSIYVLRRGRE